MENEMTKKILKISVMILLFVIVMMFIFSFGMEYYNKLRCGNKSTINKMKNYCEKNGMILKDMKFTDGLCISICGRG